MFSYYIFWKTVSTSTDCEFVLKLKCNKSQILMCIVLLHSDLKKNNLHNTKKCIFFHI